MQQLKEYTGSSIMVAYGHLLMCYYQAKKLPIPEKLHQIQNLERFDYALWRDLSALWSNNYHNLLWVWEIAKYVQPKHLGIIGVFSLVLLIIWAKRLQRYHDFHRLIYDGGPLQVEAQNDYLMPFVGSELPVHMTTQLTDEIAIALIMEFLKHFMQL